MGKQITCSKPDRHLCVVLHCSRQQASIGSKSSPHVCCGWRVCGSRGAAAVHCHWLAPPPTCTACKSPLAQVWNPEIELRRAAARSCQAGPAMKAESPQQLLHLSSASFAAWLWFCSQSRLHAIIVQPVTCADQATSCSLTMFRRTDGITRMIFLHSKLKYGSLIGLMLAPDRASGLASCMTCLVA